MKKYSSIKRVNSHRISRNRRYLGIIIALILSCFLLWLTPKVVAKVASLVFTPVHTIANWVRYSGDSLPQYVRDRKDLIDQITYLQSLASEETVASLTIKALRAENNELKSLQPAGQEERILAGVIARPTETPYDVIVLDRGANDGVVEKAPVYVASSTVIGFISQVFSDSAVARLVTSPDFKTSVYIYGPNIYTNAEGMGGGVLRVGVPQGITLEKGDLVILPSVHLGLFGEISEIQSNPSDPEQFGFATTKLPLQQIRLVNIGRQPLATASFIEAVANVEETVNELLMIDIPDNVLVDINSTSTDTEELEIESE